MVSSAKNRTKWASSSRLSLNGSSGSRPFQGVCLNACSIWAARSSLSGCSWLLLPRSRNHVPRMILHGEPVQYTGNASRRSTSTCQRSPLTGTVRSCAVGSCSDWFSKDGGGETFSTLLFWRYVSSSIRQSWLESGSHDGLLAVMRSRSTFWVLFYFLFVCLCLADMSGACIAKRATRTVVVVSGLVSAVCRLTNQRT